MGYKRGKVVVETSVSSTGVGLVLTGVTYTTVTSAAFTCLLSFYICRFACLSDVCNFQVVFSLVEPAGDMFALPGDLIDANEWVRVFLRTGGMQHLLILLGKDGGIDPSQV